MSKFILVHEASNGSPIVINTSNIVIIAKSEMFTGCSKIQLNDLDLDCPKDQIHVAESPEKIFETLK